LTSSTRERAERQIVRVLAEGVLDLIADRVEAEEGVGDRHQDERREDADRADDPEGEADALALSRGV